ncbi:MAG: choice-of-anchor D domain-containing protein [Candidatus Kapaibacterium sp.]
MKLIVPILFAVFAVTTHVAVAQFPAPCDADKSCLGRAYTGSVSTGAAVDYLVVTKTPSLATVSSAMTFEAWIKPTKQAGTTVLIGGLWGERTDENDVWQMYINAADELVFEINSPNANKGNADNTLAKTSAAGLYGKWTHVAGVFDGTTQTVYLYINGGLVNSNKNSQYPASILRVPADAGTQMMIGAHGGLPKSSNNRVYVGQMDEIRLWKRALRWDELYCNSNKSLAGNEADLVMYYRCNDVEKYGTIFCDATGNGNTGNPRGQAVCSASDRTLQNKIVTTVAGVTGKTITDDMKCDSTKQWSVTATDTSMCGSSGTLAVVGTDAKYFTVAPTTVTLNPNQPVNYTISFKGTPVGPVLAGVRYVGANRCTIVDTVKFTFNRLTELTYKYKAPDNRLKSSITFDTMFVGCSQTPYHDSTIRICNQSNLLGTPHDVTITNLSTIIGQAFAVVSPTTPITLKVGECIDVVVRFTIPAGRDTTFRYLDSLKITSTDCQAVTKIPLAGQVQLVFQIMRSDGKTKIANFPFASTCPNDLSASIAWNWYNRTLRNIFIDSVSYPPQIVPVRVPRVFPYTLQPSSKVGELEKYWRFKPSAPGLLNGEIVYYARLAGSPCTFIIRIPFSGRGLDNDVTFSTPQVEFGNVVVGKQSTLPVTFTNNSTTDVMNISFYLKQGDVFVFPGAKTASLSPGQSKTINVTFRPVDAIDYNDELCLFEQRCFTTHCIPVHGKGYIERFKFDSTIMNIKNVISCKDSVGHIDIINVSSSAQSLTNFTLNDPSGKFTHVDNTGTPIPLPGSVPLNVNESKRFYFKFTPNDNTQDLAIRSYLQYKSSSGDDWMVQLRASSVVPKLYITPLTVFGSIEAGDTKRDTITLENISPVPVRADNISLPPGFVIVSQTKQLPNTLQPRDSIQFVVDFKPTQTQVYDGDVTVNGSDPCPNIVTKGKFTAKAILLKMDSPFSIQNFSYVRPCDCKTRDIPLTNPSHVHDVIIDSLFIDGKNIAGATPQLFSFTSKYYELNNKQIPFTLPHDSSDVLLITYCPKTTAQLKNVTSAAKLWIQSHTSVWSQKDSVLLVGKRAMTFRPDSTNFLFPPTPVDAYAAMKAKQDISNVFVPGYTENPYQEIVQIDSVSFSPDERVFYAVDTLGNPIKFPVVLDPATAKTSKYPIRFRFKPRAKRAYQARAVLYLSKPCNDKDTTILLQGTGVSDFKYTLDFRFDSTATNQSVFKASVCDTFHIPVYSYRKLPPTSANRSLIDIRCRLLYDTTKLNYVGVTSQFTTTPQDFPTNGREVLLKNCQDVDSMSLVMTAHLTPKVPLRDTVAVQLDSLKFDSPEVLKYNLDDSRGDKATLIVIQPDMKVQQQVVDFDSVRILDCVQKTFSVKNTGDTSITIDSLLSQLPKEFAIVNSVPAKNQPIPVGDSCVVTIEFCPRNTDTLNSVVQVASMWPCSLRDSLPSVKGRGYAPAFPVLFATDNTNFTKPADVGGILGDTIVVPVYCEKDFNQTYHGNLYWVKALNFTVNMKWNPYMLKFISATSVFGNQMSTDTKGSLSNVDLNFSTIDDLKAGKIADVTFLLTVPDVPQDTLVVTPKNFQTDSLLFLEINPHLKPTKTNVLTSEKCKTTTLIYSGTRPALYQTIPNPANGSTTIRFDIQETVPVSLKVYSASGELVAELYNGQQTLKGGQHSATFDTSKLAAGVYNYVLHAGVFSEVRQMVVVK